MQKHGPVLSGSEIEQFVEMGFLSVEQAIPSAESGRLKCRGDHPGQVNRPENRGAPTRIQGSAAGWETG